MDRTTLFVQKSFFNVTLEVSVIFWYAVNGF